MNKKACQTLEIRLMDMALGNLTAMERQELMAHLDACEGCRSVYLEMVGMTQGSGEAAAVRPSMRVKERLMQRVKSDLARKKQRAERFGGLASGFRASYLLPVTGIAVVLFLLWAVPIGGNWMMASKKDDPWQMTQAAETEQYPIRQEVVLTGLNHESSAESRVVRAGDPVENDGSETVPVEGNIWLNRQSGEVLLVVDGLRPLTNADYQVWVTGNGRAENAGIVKVVSRYSLLYYHGQSRMRAESMWLTIEPAGGGERPTGPKVLQVNFE